MPRVNTFAARPGSLLRAWDTTWRIIENNTLDQYLILEDIDRRSNRKRVRYQPGDEIFLRWIPHRHVD